MLRWLNCLGRDPIKAWEVGNIGNKRIGLRLDGVNPRSESGGYDKRRDPGIFSDSKALVKYHAAK